MKILLTGASSFTGYHFARILAEDGNQVVATFTRPRDGYAGNALGRIGLLEGLDGCRLVFGAKFGSGPFMDLLGGEGPFDMLCAHGAVVGDYKGAGFDVEAAVGENTHGLDGACRALAGPGGGSVMLTRSYFETCGSSDLAFNRLSPYAQSKMITTERFHSACVRHSLPLAEFMVPNPFGPMENDRARLTTYLMGRWKQGEAAEISHPGYVRDNIHVRALAASYLRCAKRLAGGTDSHLTARPSGYVMTNGEFARMVAAQSRERTGLECPVRLARQADWDEPRELRNVDRLRYERLGLSERGLWDEFVGWYYPGGKEGL